MSFDNKLSELNLMRLYGCGSLERAGLSRLGAVATVAASAAEAGAGLLGPVAASDLG